MYSSASGVALRKANALGLQRPYTPRPNWLIDFKTIWLTRFKPTL